MINLGRFAKTMMNDAIVAYTEANAFHAQEVWNRDKEFDEMYTALFRELGRGSAPDIWSDPDVVYGA